MLQPYVPVLVLIAFVVANAILMLGVSHVFSTYRRTPTKIAPYEMTPFRTCRSSNGSIIPCSRAMRVIQRSDMIVMRVGA